MTDKMIHMTEDGPAAQRVGGTTFRPGRQGEIEESIADAVVDAFDYFEEGEAPDTSDEDEESGTVTSEDVTADFPGEDEWLEPEYEERVEAVESGEADSYLDEVEEVERSQQVLDAVEDRRDELEE